MMLFTKKTVFTLLLVAGSCINAISLHAAQKTPEIAISTGGYAFNASYKLEMPPSSSDLVVKMRAGSRGSVVSLAEGGPMLPGTFYIELQFPTNTGTSSIEMIPQGDKKPKIIKLDKNTASI